MTEVKITIQNKRGIHCRPSALIVKALEGYTGQVTVVAETGTANPTSMIELLCLGLAQGEKVVIQVEGPDSGEMANKMKSLFEENFDFEPLAGESNLPKVEGDDTPAPIIRQKEKS